VIIYDKVYIWSAFTALCGVLFFCMHRWDGMDGTEWMRWIQDVNGLGTGLG
jgi:hypothetical protein